MSRSALWVVRLAAEIVAGSQMRAPEDEGDLVAAHYSRVTGRKPNVEAEITVGPVEHNGFNYAVAMHEGVYELGEFSEAKNEGKTPHYGDGVGRKFLELIPQSWGYVIPRCGHWVMIERPEEFYVATSNFLATAH